VKKGFSSKRNEFIKSNKKREVVFMLSVEEIREKILPVCQKYAINEAYLFGSYARGDATEDSDVDLRIVVGKPFGMLALNRLNDEFEAALQKNVDVITHLPKNQAIRFYDSFAHNVSQEEVRVYGQG